MLPTDSGDEPFFLLNGELHVIKKKSVLVASMGVIGACKARTYGETKSKREIPEYINSPHKNCYYQADKNQGKVLCTCKGEKDGIDVCVIRYDEKSDVGQWLVMSAGETTDFFEDHIHQFFNRAEKETDDQLNLIITAEEALFARTKFPSGAVEEKKLGDGQMRRKFVLDKKNLTATYRRRNNHLPKLSI